MIILEGPDNAGKTTLGEHLSQHLGLEFQHSGGPIRSREDFEERMAKLHSGPAVVMDRFPAISEHVYGQIFKRPAVFDFNEQMQLALSKGWAFIYCRPPLAHLIDQSTHRPSAHTAPGVSPEEYAKQIFQRQQSIIELYDRVMDGVPHFKFDFKNVTPVFYPRLVQALRRFQP